MCNDVKENLCNAVNSLAKHFHNYLVAVDEAPDEKKDDLVIHTCQLILLNLLVCRYKEDVFDHDFMQWKLSLFVDLLHTQDNKKKLEYMFRETHDRLISYRDLTGG